MPKRLGLVLTVTFLLLGGSVSRHATFSKYKPVEAYEIRPGILMMPTFSADGRLCEVGLEKLHYTPDKVVLSSALSRAEIQQIVNELAPVNERGPRPTNLLARGGTEIEGRALVDDEEYKNVSIRIYSEASARSSPHHIYETDIVATINWHHPGCK